MGQKFKAAREKKRVSLSQAAVKTRIKVQLLEAMEKDDFSPMAAPAYAKGFIRMYAEYLGMDSVPLVQEYNERHLNKSKDVESSAVSAPTSNLAGEAGLLWSRVKQLVKDMLASPAMKRPAVRAALGLAALFVVLSLARCGGSPDTKKKVESAPRPASHPALAVIKEPPAPYLQVATPSAGNP